jgi:hypothetical protein
MVLSSAKVLAGSPARKSKANERAAQMARLDKVRLLLGEDEFVEAGQAQTISVVAVPDMQFTVRLEQLSTVYLTVPDADLTKAMNLIPLA